MTLQRSLWTLLILVAVTVVGLSRLRLDVEVLHLLPREVKSVEGLEIYQRQFADSGELIVALETREASRAEDLARSLGIRLRAAADLVTHAHWTPPWLEAPDQTAEWISYLWLNQAPEAFQALAQRLSPESRSQTLQQARENLAHSLSPLALVQGGYDPYGLLNLPEQATGQWTSPSQGQELFSSSDGKLRLIFVRAAQDLSNFRACQEWLQKIKGIIDAWKTEADPSNETQIGLTGRPVFVSEIAGGMERDITGSVLGTAAVIALLFWIAHRRFRPLASLILVLSFVLLCTFGLSGVFLGRINVISAGFAAIVLGLAADYGLVLYQEYISSPGETRRSVRRRIKPAIFWSALTTASAFLLMNGGGMPGLSQLGTLVAIGIVLAAIFMLNLFLPMAVPTELERAPSKGRAVVLPSAAAWAFTGMIAGSALVYFARHPPRVHHGPDALRPRNSEAYRVLDQVRNGMNQESDPYWIIFSGRNEAEVAARLASFEQKVAAGAEQIEGQTLPTSFWPVPERHLINEVLAAELVQQREGLREAALQAGFAEPALTLLDGCLQGWKTALSTTNFFWPSNKVSSWILNKVTSRTPDRLFALGLVHPLDPPPKEAARWVQSLGAEGVWVTGWNLLGQDVLVLAEKNVLRITLWMTVLLTLGLWLAFRRVTEVALSFGTFILSGLSLWGVMGIFGWSWNLMNLMAVPLLIGLGVDYTIHVQFALKRHPHDPGVALGPTRRALFLCAATTIAGFGSLAWSGNAGLASLGQVCAAGVLIIFLISILLLPGCWLSLSRRLRVPAGP